MSSAAFINQFSRVVTFTLAGGAGAKLVAKWSNGAWSAFGHGLDPGGGEVPLRVNALVQLPNGDVVAGGSFEASNGVAVNRIARWNGTAWEPLGLGVDGEVSAIVALANGDVIAGGHFLSADGSPAQHIAHWSGFEWSPIETGTEGPVRALAVDSNGDVLVGGTFFNAGDRVSAYWARWACACYANCDGSGVVPVLTANDFQCFLNKFAAAQSLPPWEQASQYANCDGSTALPVLNANDFQCFLNRIAAGCP